MDLYNSVFSVLNRELLTQTGISLAKFDAMAQLSRYPNGISMSDLSTALRVSNGNVSGLVNRMIKEDLVQKQISQSDRRSFHATLTVKGKEKFAQALITHKDVLANLFADLEPEQLSQTVSDLRHLAGNLSSRGI